MPTSIKIADQQVIGHLNVVGPYLHCKKQCDKRASQANISPGTPK